MFKAAGCFNFLRGRRSLHREGEVVSPLEVQQPRRHHGGSEVVSDLSHVAGYSLTRPCSQQILAF